MWVGWAGEQMGMAQGSRERVSSQGCIVKMKKLIGGGGAARGPRGGNCAGWVMAQQFGVDADSGLGESWASGCEERRLC